MSIPLWGASGTPDRMVLAPDEFGVGTGHHLTPHLTSYARDTLIALACLLARHAARQLPSRE